MNSRLPHPSLVLWSCATAWCAGAGLAVAQKTDLRLLSDFIGRRPADVAGYSVDEMGDIDGDGFGDYLVGAVGCCSPPYEGRTYIVSGATRKIIRRFDGDDLSSLFGFSVSSIDDLDGDSIKDVIVGAPYTGDGFEGKAWVLSTASGAALFTMNSTDANEWLGYSVSDVDDTNGDGVADILIGIPQSGNLDSGKAVLYSGANGQPLLEVAGVEFVELFGRTVAGLGDLDHDGRGDFAVGAPFRTTKVCCEGAAFAYSGATGALLFAMGGERVNSEFGTGLACAGDVNADGTLDVVVGAPLDNKFGAQNGRAFVFSGVDGGRLYTLDNGSEGAQWFGYSVCGPGDLDRDGFDDFVVGAPYGSHGHGVAHFFSGKTGKRINQFVGYGWGEHAGVSVAPAGDINRDRIPDVLIGSPNYYVDLSYPKSEGRAYVVSLHEVDKR